MPKYVVFDTNFFLILGRQKRDVYGDIKAEGWQVVLLAPVYAELEKLSQGRSLTANAARIALSFIKQKGLNIVPGSNDYADTAILAYCQQTGAAAATQDAALRAQLRAARVRVITLNRSGKLHTEEPDVLQAQSSGPHSRPTRPIR